MKLTINLSEFRTQFAKSERKDTFSYDGLETLFNYLDENNPDHEFDLIELCCEYSEYSDFEELQTDYKVDTIEELEGKTLVLQTNSDSLIIQKY